jgi:hypothetical protein
MPSAARPRAGLRRPALRLVFVLAVGACLVAGIAGGLLRAGVALPPTVSGRWLDQAVAEHAFLMICAFMGTVIGIERAVAVKKAFAHGGPIASALAGASMLCGAPSLARWLVVAASVAFIGVNVLVVLRQRAAHCALLLVAAIAWAAGSLLHALDTPSGAAVPWWFSFLVLTIGAERLEMTRLMRRHEGASGALWAIVAAMLLGAAASVVSPVWGGTLYGMSLLCLAIWLLCFDIARRTVLAHGLSRYMAVCLLLGYGWLLVAGAAWVAASLGLPMRDAALHALALGFVFSMMLGHAPVILPAIARVKVLFGWAYYIPLALLHGSLLLRLVAGHADPKALAAGATGNALAIAAFAVTVVGSAVAWRLEHSSPRAERRNDITPGP